MSGLSDINPLTESHLMDINKALAQLDTAFKQIALAKQAGIDVAAQEAMATDARTKLLQLKQVYFPGR